jgi:t-SNARE complex subunit (syntaxin)
MSHAADALTIDQSYRLQKQVEKLETGQAEELKQVRSEMEHLKHWMKSSLDTFAKYTRPLDRELAEQINLHSHIMDEAEEG